MGIEKDDDRRTGPTQDRTQNSRTPRQLMQARQQRTEWSAVRLVQAIFKRGCK